MPASRYLQVRYGALVHDWKLLGNKPILGCELPQNHRVDEHPSPHDQRPHNPTQLLFHVLRQYDCIKEENGRYQEQNHAEYLKDHHLSHPLQPHLFHAIKCQHVQQHYDEYDVDRDTDDSRNFIIKSPDVIRPCLVRHNFNNYMNI